MPRLDLRRRECAAGSVDAADFSAVAAFALLASLTVTQLGGTVVGTRRFRTDGATLENT